MKAHLRRFDPQPPRRFEVLMRERSVTRAEPSGWGGRNRPQPFVVAIADPLGDPLLIKGSSAWNPPPSRWNSSEQVRPLLRGVE